MCSRWRRLVSSFVVDGGRFRLTGVAARSDEARRTLARPGGRDAPPAVLTAALPLTAGAVASSLTRWGQDGEFQSPRRRRRRHVTKRAAPTSVTPGPLVARGAVAAAGHRVAELVGPRALADLVTVTAKGPWKTSWGDKGGQGGADTSQKEPWRRGRRRTPPPPNSPCSQPLPVNPGGQPHCPVT